MGALVSLVKYSSSPDSLREAISLCDGFYGIRPTGSVLIKPNLVTWDNEIPIPPFGVFTSTRLMEDLIVCLKDFGCSKITIGEGSVEMNKGIGTKAAFAGLGYDTLSRYYGVQLVDFNDSQTREYDIPGGDTLHIAEEALHHDFVINVPVLKTHAQTKVSLGLKNLKGCLAVKSKKACHNPGGHLEDRFTHIADLVNPSLTIVDGIYALERGALHFGNAYRKNVIIASSDVFAADVTGSKIMGYDVQEIDHLARYAERKGIVLSTFACDVVGENMTDHIHALKWDWTWNKANTGPAVFDKLGVSNVAVPKYDETLCSGCSLLANMTNILVLAAKDSPPAAPVEILNGKKMKARSGYEKTILLGNCIIKANKVNRHIREAIKVPGCPPSVDDVVTAFQAAGIKAKKNDYIRFLKQQSTKYDGREGFDLSFFTKK
ncbi:MAG: DUF362 domain-containing protein [Thermodesulfobacteriota bacterium]|nr:DUF362 domain-containing protein [Thermodesulfobacteriota bacterium]